ARRRTESQHRRPTVQPSDLSREGPGPIRRTVRGPARERRHRTCRLLRRRGHVRRLLLAAAAAVMALGVVPTAAHADAPRDQGWWTVTNPLPAPPDVPARGLLVQGGGGGAPTAIAAVLYELDSGATAGTLTLAVAPNSATTPGATLQLCPLLQPINHAEQGGPMADAPPYNCGHKVTA